VFRNTVYNVIPLNSAGEVALWWGRWWPHTNHALVSGISLL